MRSMADPATAAEQAFFTADKAKRICDAIRLGATYEIAAKYGGISYRTFRRWVVWGEGGDPVFEPFVRSVHDAEGAGALTWLAVIEKAAKDGAWQAAAWKLERRYPGSYNKTGDGREEAAETAADPVSARAELERLAAAMGLRLIAAEVAPDSYDPETAG